MTLSPQTAQALPSPLDDIAAERIRQINVEGWSLEHDDEHWQGEMAAAAACYALRGSISDPDIEGSIRGCHPLGRSNLEVGEFIEKIWPRVWDWKWWKPKNRRNSLIKAAALIVAEIERLDRHSAIASAEREIQEGKGRDEHE